MKKTLIFFVAVISCISAKAQVIDITNIELNTQSTRVVTVPKTAEPERHFFVNAGAAVCNYGTTAVNIMAGLYKLNGFYASYTRKMGKNPESSFTEVNDIGSSKSYKNLVNYNDISAATFGWIYNFPLSRSTGNDIDNVIQFYAGAGFGSTRTVQEQTRSTVCYNQKTLVLDLGFMFRLSHFNFIMGGSIITPYAALKAGIGYTF